MRNEQLKGRLLEVVEDPVTGRSAEIRFDKKSALFYCTILEDEKNDHDLTIVRAWARQLLRKGSVIDWTPVISVQEGGDSYSYRDKSRKGELDEYAELEIEIDRFFVGKTPGGV